MSERILVFIPAYNCADQIPRVFEKFDDDVQSLVDEVIVVENRSTDATLAVASDMIRRIAIPGKVFQNRENYSLGGSIKVALLYALEHGFDHIVVVHGDDQGDIRDLVGPIRAGLHHRNDLVIGARFHKGSKLIGYSTVRIVGNRILNAVMSVVARRRIDDLIAGLNIFSVRFFEDRTFLNFPDSLTFDAHTLLEAVNRHAPFTFVPITWRDEDQVSNAKTVRQALTILRLIMRYAIRGDRVFRRNESGRSDGFRYPSDLIATANV